MTTLRPSLVMIVLAAMLMSPAVLRPTVARADATSEAKALFDRGNRALTAALSMTGDRRRVSLENAVDAYVESLKIARNRNVLFNTGVALQELNRNEDAATYFMEYLAFTDLATTERADAQARFDSVAAKTVLVDVTSEPAGASVRVDRPDMPVCGVTPLRIAVSPGATHRIFVARQGYEASIMSVSGKAGDVGPLRAKLVPVPVPVTVHARPGDRVRMDGTPVETNAAIAVLPGTHEVRVDGTDIAFSLAIVPGQAPVTVDVTTAPREGSLSVLSNVPAEVSVDGKAAGKGKRVDLRLPEGTHDVVVKAEGRAPARSTVTVASHAPAVLRADLVDEDAGSTTYGAWPTLTWIGAGVALTTTVALSLAASVAKSDFDDVPTRANADNVDTWNARADVGWGVTAALGITALVLTLTNDREVSESSVVLGAAPLAGGGMVTARVGFP